jgi:outer membrane lipoprotein-sorting protein
MLMHLNAGRTEAAPSDADLAPLKKWIAAQSELKTMEIDFVQRRKLGSLRNPTESKGRIWMESGGKFRWEIGSPLRTVMVKGDKALHVLRVKRKAAEVYGLDALKDDSRLRGLAFIEAGFPRSLEEFQKIFQILSVENKNGLVSAKMSLRDKQVATAVHSVEFTIDPSDNILQLVHVDFRDKSWVETAVKQVRKNPDIPSSRFEIDLTGYQVEKKN